jgi:hypothetical protein
MVYKHHIIPFHEWKRRVNTRCTRSNKEFNAHDNVVWLTLEQHIQVHRLLYEINNSCFDLLASQMLSGHIGKEEGIVLAIKEANIGNQYTLGYKHTQEWKRNMSILMAGNTYPLGLKHTERHKKRISEGMMGKRNGLGYKFTVEQSRSQSARQRGKIRGPYRKRETVSC